MRLLLVLAAPLLLLQPANAEACRRSCLSGYGEIACGYDCKAAYGQVRCAQTPAGACLAAYGEVQCWDPADYAWGMPRGQCVSAYGAIACGYDCKAAYGETRCAQTPGGACA